MFDFVNNFVIFITILKRLSFLLLFTHSEWLRNENESVGKQKTTNIVECIKVLKPLLFNWNYTFSTMLKQLNVHML